MKVRLRLQLTGTRDGEPWPPPGTVVDLPDHEAADLVAAGLAADPDEDVEDRDDLDDEDDDGDDDLGVY